MTRHSLQLALLLTLAASSGALQLAQLGAGSGAGDEVGSGVGSGTEDGAGNGAGNGAENEDTGPTAVDVSAWLSETGKGDEAESVEERHAYLLAYLRTIKAGGTPEAGVAQAIEAVRARVAATRGPQLASATANGHLELLARDPAWYKATVKAKADDLALAMQAAAAETHKVFYRDFVLHYALQQYFLDAQETAAKTAQKAMAARYGQVLGAALAQEWAKDVSGQASFKVSREAERKAEQVAAKFVKAKSGGAKEAQEALKKAMADASDAFYLAYLDDVARGAGPEAAVATAIEAQREFLAGAAGPQAEAEVSRQHMVELATDAPKVLAAAKADATELSNKMTFYEQACAWAFHSLYRMMADQAKQPKQAAMSAGHEYARQCLSGFLGERLADRIVSRNHGKTTETD